MPPDQKPTKRSLRAPLPLAIAPVELAAGLHVVATPIGHLGDVTLRALATLAAADLVLCEDTRVTRKLLDRYGLNPPLLAYHDHNAAEVRPRILRRLADSAAIALVSDAGTPLISDPGYKLVAAALEAGHRVYPVPGASALLAALVAAGLPTDRFYFEGFLPSKAGQRRNRIAELVEIPATLVLYETGPRLAESGAEDTGGRHAVAAIAGEGDAAGRSRTLQQLAAPRHAVAHGLLRPLDEARPEARETAEISQERRGGSQ